MTLVVSDGRVRDWALALAQREGDVLAAARRAFCRKPSSKRLHVLRTAARRVRSLREDVNGALPATAEKPLRRLIKRSGATRDAASLRSILKAVLDDGEREIVEALLNDLRSKERCGLRRVRNLAKRLQLP